jgi:hypothetical protein
LVQDESKQYRDSLELYDHEKRQTFFWNRVNHKEKGYSEVKENKDMTPFSQDLLSSLLYLRTVSLPDGGHVRFPLTSEGKNFEALVSVVRREEISTPWGRVKAVVVKPQAFLNGELQNKNDSFLWFSDDERRQMLRLEAKLKVGSVTAVCKRIEAGEPRP